MNKILNYSCKMQKKFGWLNRNKVQCQQKTVTNMIDINLTISMIMLNDSGLNIPIKRQRL